MKLRAAQAWRTRIKRLLVVLFLLFSVGLSFVGDQVGAWDNFPDWHAGEPIARVSGDYVTQNDADASQRSCVVQSVTVEGYDPQAVCVTQMHGWRYALYGHAIDPYGSHQSETLFIVSLGADSRFYVVENMGGSQAPLDIPGTDTLVYANPYWSDIFVYRNVSHHLERTARGYRMDESADMVTYADGTDVWQVGAAAARGGGWMVAETGRGIVRISLTTLETRIISTFTTATAGSFSGAAQLGISDDGQTVFASGRPYEQRSFAEITVTDGCGVATSTPLVPGQECPGTDLTAPFTDGTLPDGWPLDFTVGAHGNRVSFFVQGVDGKYTRASLYPSGSAPFSLHYLALGDSYSSGEGDGQTDAEGEPYYLPHTNVTGVSGVPKEMCHVSSRSYPFDLAAMAAVTPGPLAYGMESVACNNAHITYVTAHPDGYYQGQDGRLGGLNTAQLDDFRTAAQNEFIPGRISQSDFVEAYQPASVSLGIGGNDVQFARVVTACASSIVTCDYASDPTDRRNLGESIKALYPKLTALYTELSRDDPGASVYAVGYPRLVNETNETCPATVNLDYAERQMLDQGVRYINQVIQSAAISAGVGYLDVQDALVGHRLCDGPAEYVNGLDPLSLFTAQEQFHPTASGHEAMALAIERQLGGADLALHNPCPERTPCPNPTGPPGLPVFFGDASVRPTYIAVPSELVQMTGSLVPYMVEKGVEFAMQTSLLASGSTVRIELHSQALDLGTAMVGADGTLSVPLTLPDSVAAGYHTLHVYGTSPSGEAVDVYQIIYVADHQAGALAAATQGPPDSPASPTLPIPSTLPSATASVATPRQSPLNVALNTIKTLPVTLSTHPTFVFASLFITGSVAALIAAVLLWHKRAP